jgi:hypothetical protein
MSKKNLNFLTLYDMPHAGCGYQAPSSYYVVAEEQEEV